jgi:hypothetical protein
VTVYAPHRWPRRAKSPRGEDLTGKCIGNVVVLSRAGFAGRQYWLCRCDCGGEELIAQENLLDPKRKTPPGCRACVKANMRKAVGS